MNTTLYCLPSLFQTLPALHPALFVVLFLQQNVSSRHFLGVILFNDIIDLNLLSLSTLVLTARCCLF